MKKTLYVLLSLVMLIGLLAGCADGSSGSSGGDGDTVTISVALWEVDPAFLDGDAVYDLVRERFNIEIVPLSLTWDDYHEKVNTWVATGDMPDVFNIDLLPYNNKLFFQWVREGVIHPLPGNLSQYPNLQQIFALDDVAATAVEGVFYNIPRGKADASGFAWATARGCYYRKDWAQQLGLNEPTNMNEFVEFVRAMVEGAPGITGGDVVGITSYGTSFLIDYMWHSMEPRRFGSWQVEADGTVMRAFDAPNTYEAALTIRNMYNDGLIDPDIAIQDTEAGFNKFATNRAALVAYQMEGGNEGMIFDRFIANNPDKPVGDTIGYLKLLRNENDGNYYFFNTTSYWSETYISADVDEIKLHRILQLADFFASEEWMDIVKHGIEGVDWKKSGNNVEYLTDDGSRPDVFSKYRFLEGFSFFSTWFEGVHFWDTSFLIPEVKDMTFEFYDWVVQNGTPEPQSFAFDMVSTPLSEEFVNDSWDMLMRFLFGRTGGDPRAEWDEIIQSLEAAGLSAMVAEMAEAARESGAIS